MPKERKVILIVGAILLSLAALYRFYPSLKGIAGEPDEIARKQERAAHYQRISSAIKDTEAEIIALHRMLERAEFVMFRAEKDSLAAVDIKNILTDLSQRSGIDIQVMRDLPFEQKKPEHTNRFHSLMDVYPPIRVEISFNAHIEQIKNFLYRIETHDKLLLIEDAKFVALLGRQKDLIRSTMTIQGRMKKMEL